MNPIPTRGVTIGHRGIGVAVEGGEAVRPVPGPAVVGVENVRAVGMHMDAFHGFGVNISGDVGPFFDHQHPLATVRRLPGKHRPVQARADDQIIILLHSCFLFYFLIFHARTPMTSLFSAPSLTGEIFRVTGRSSPWIRSL